MQNTQQHLVVKRLSGRKRNTSDRGIILDQQIISAEQKPDGVRQCIPIHLSMFAESLKKGQVHVRVCTPSTKRWSIPNAAPSNNTRHADDLGTHRRTYSSISLRIWKATGPVSSHNAGHAYLRDFIGEKLFERFTCGKVNPSEIA